MIFTTMEIVMIMISVAFISNLMIICHMQTFCDDGDECESETISNSYIYCRGYSSCSSADLTSTSYDIYCLGYRGCDYADIDSADDVWCKGYYGCYYADIIADTDVYCDGDYACYDTDIEAPGDIDCSGYYSCQYATINDALSVKCYSYYSCKDVAITGVSIIYACGFYSLYSATISSSGVSPMTVYLYGYYAGDGLSITCYSGDTCYIYCKSNGCYNTDINCYGTCYVSCDESSEIDCPNGYDSTSTSTSSSSTDCDDDISSIILISIIILFIIFIIFTIVLYKKKKSQIKELEIQLKQYKIDAFGNNRQNQQYTGEWMTNAQYNYPVQQVVQRQQFISVPNQQIQQQMQPQQIQPIKSYNQDNVVNSAPNQQQPIYHSHQMGIPSDKESKSNEIQHPISVQQLDTPQITQMPQIEEQVGNTETQLLMENDTLLKSLDNIQIPSPPAKDPPAEN